MRPEPTVLVLAEMIFGLAVLVAAIVVFVAARAFQRRGGLVAQAQVIGRTSRRIQVRYVVDGTAYEIHGSTNYADPPPLGTWVPVCFSPASPSNACIMHENFVGTIAGAVVALVFGVIGGGLCWAAYAMG